MLEQERQAADDAWSDRRSDEVGGAWILRDGFSVWKARSVIRPFNLQGPDGFVGSFKTLEAAKAKARAKGMSK